MEEQQSEVQHAALDYDKSGQFKEHRSSTEYFVLDEAQSKEHTFAVEWTPEELIFYTDGKGYPSGESGKMIPNKCQVLTKWFISLVPQENGEVM